MKTLLGMAAVAAAATGTFAVATPSAQAAQLPCFLAGSGSSASATCYSGSSYTWRLVADCLDTSNIKWPKIVNTKYGAYIKGDGTESLSCASGLRAVGRIEAR
jgi:hypothetical protein